MLGIYIHLPFCRRKCLYCDFNSYVGLERLIDGYTHALCSEIENRSAAVGTPVYSIYFGGGTPTLLPVRALERILNHVRDSFDVVAAAEVSIEANPETIDVDKIESLKKSGFNRLSLGFQSLDDELLKFLGRGHSAIDAIGAFRAAREAGFDNISVDLIFGIPGQTLAGWAGTLSQIAVLSPEHVSAYSLTVEEGTPLANLVEDGEILPPGEDEVAEMFELSIDFLVEKGFEHYEISNFALAGKGCRHNMIYWESGDYLGFGAGAHSKIDNERLENVAGVAEYIDGVAAGEQIVQRKLLVAADRLSETLFLGLRKIEGIDLDDLAARFGKEALNRYSWEIANLIKDGLLVEVDGRLRLTRRGVFLGNEVFSRFA
ncbi:MAG: radical SAM family heme chaperone HemW [Actinobacteria bacterium]|nr:radical SAM family heme chaperone HemW [Actinomycetota bacterium]